MKPQHERARSAIEFYAQKIGMRIYVAKHVRRGRWSPNDFTFAVDLRIGDEPFWSGEYTMGSGHAKNGQPPKVEIADVLPSIFMDASSYENAQDLHDFCAEFGYVGDEQGIRNSHGGQQAYEGCRKAAHRLRDGLDDQQHATFEQLSNMV